MRLLYSLKTIIIFNIILLSSFAHSEPLLNGIASHQELGKDQFIGALFSEKISTNASTLLAADQPTRMELKILAEDGISARRFSRMWIDGMAINNNSDVLTNQANNIVKFDSLFKGRLISGDHVIFNLKPGLGVSISVNGVVLGNIKDDAFFPLLLSSWIGKIPLSSDFKDNMLKVGEEGTMLRGRFDQIKPATYRVTEIASWTGQAQSSSSFAASSNKATKSSAAPEIALDLKPISPATIALPPLSPTNQSASSSKASVKSSATSKPSVKHDDDEDSAPAFTAETLLARQFYLKEVIKSINKKVRYPSYAAQRGHEGSVRIDVRLDRDGKITEITASEPSRHSELTKEAIAAINRAAPFPALPDAISGEGFEFSAPIRFQLLQKSEK